MSSIFIGIIGFLVVIVFFFLGMPIAYSMILVGFVGFAYLTSIQAASVIVAIDFYQLFASYVLTVIPLFIWMGYIALNAGISQRLFNVAYQFLGSVKGGVLMAAEMACAAFGAVCGSNSATVATMGAVALPEIKRYKYDLSLATGSISAGGTLGILIPPSSAFIVYGILTEQSIGKLFMAGIFPGILLMLLFMATIYVVLLTKPSTHIPAPQTSLKEKLMSIPGGAGETVLIFAMVVGGLMAGIFTPTEAGAVGVIAVLVVALARRQIGWKGFANSMAISIRTSVMIYLLLIGAVVYGHFITVSGITTGLAEWAVGLPVPNVIILMLILAIYFVLGCFIDSMALLTLTVPIFYPVCLELGYDPIWFGVILILVLGMGTITPPVGISVYVMKGVAKEVPIETIFKGALPFLIAIAISIALVTIVPQIALFLPGIMK